MYVYRKGGHFHMKKILAILLCIVMALSLIACGKEKGTLNPESEMMKPLVSKLDSVLMVIGQENGLIFIVNTDNKDFPFIHSQAGKDLTEIVKARLEGKIIPLNEAVVPAPEGQAPAVQPAPAEQVAKP